jgi:hypothetical protein
LKCEIDELQWQLKKRDKIVEELETQMDKLNHKMKLYDSDQDRLYICQVAVEFERALCSHVIPNVFSIDKGISSANLDKLLNMLNIEGPKGLKLIPLDSKKYDVEAIRNRAH